MRVLEAHQLEKQYSPTKLLAYKVEIKPSEESLDAAYIDVTDEIAKVSLDLNIEGEPSRATIEVISTKGKYDLLNVRSEYRNRYKMHAKVRIYAGFNTAVNLVFTGYVQLGFGTEYEKNQQEIIPISLYDRAGILSERIIDSDLYTGTTEVPERNVKEILEDILTVEAGFLSTDMEIDSDLANIEVKEVQFVQENIWKIIQLCAQTKMQVGYFDDRGVLKTKPIQTSLTDWDGSNGTSLVRKKINHNFDERDLLSGVTVIGGIRFPDRSGTSVNILDLCPYGDTARGKKAFWEDATNGTGHPLSYDSLCGDPNAAEDDKKYGAGFQALIIPVDGAGPVMPGGYGNFEGWDFGFNFELYLYTANEEGGWEGCPAYDNPDNWFITVLGPFPWTVEGNPREAWQSTKTGLGDGDDMGVDGFFKKYNQDQGTLLNIEPSTVGLDDSKWNPDGEGRWWPEIFGSFIYNEEGKNPNTGFCKIGYGILPDTEQWQKEEFQKWFPVNKYPYPDIGAAPNTTEFWVYFISFFDFYSYYHGWKKHQYDGDWQWWRDLESNVFRKVIQWGQALCATTVDLPEEHWTGTYIDPELFEKYGTQRYEDVENPLLFTVEDCEFVATEYARKRKLYSIQGGLVIPLNFEIELGDVVSAINDRTNCTERVLVSRLVYNFKRGEENLVEVKGGVIDSDGTIVKVWE